MSGDAGAEAGGCCAIICYSFFGPWCNTKALGGGNGRDGCCGGPRGCCHSCFSKGFDEDEWDTKDQETRKKRTAANQTQSSQPTSTPQMTAPSTNDANTKP